MAPPLVSVIIPTYNCSRLLPESIDSALAQTYGRLEVVVVDDGSTDDTPAVCKRYGDRIRYIRRSNGGTPAARNTGLSVTQGEYVALLDHDDLWLPHKIARQVEAMESDPAIALVHTGGRVVDLETGHVTSTYLPELVLDYHDLLAWCKVGCATTLIRRSALDEVGTFDESLRGVDDWDLWIRLAWQHRVVGITEILAEIREHTSNQGHRYRRMYPIVRRCIDKPRPTHPGCRECALAVRRARRRLRQDYYVKACQHSREQVRIGSIASGIVTRANALWKYPEAVFHLPHRVMRSAATV